MTVENQPITQQEVPAFSSSVTALPENLQDQYVMMPVSSLTPEQHQMFFGPALEQEPVFSHVPEEFDELDFARLSMLRSMQFYHLTVFLQLVNMIWIVTLFWSTPFWIYALALLCFSLIGMVGARVQSRLLVSVHLAFSMAVIVFLVASMLFMVFIFSTLFHVVTVFGAASVIGRISHYNRVQKEMESLQLQA